MANTALAKQQTAADKVEAALIQGDLEQLSPDERLSYYRQVCDSVGLNPLTKPFEYLSLNNKLVLYATRNATDQLRKLQNVSIEIINRESVAGVYIVTARASTPDGRIDEATGAVALEREETVWKKNSNGKSFREGTGNWLGLRGDDLANAFLKAETKAKRRVTLSICGLSMLDETEVETIPNAARFVENEHALALNGDDDKTAGVKEEITELCRQLNALGDDREWKKSTLNAFAREKCGDDYANLNFVGLSSLRDALDLRAQPMRDALMEAELAAQDDEPEAF